MSIHTRNSDYNSFDLDVDEATWEDFKADQKETFNLDDDYVYPDFLEPGDILRKPAVKHFTMIEKEAVVMVLTKPLRYLTGPMYSREYVWHFDALFLSLGGSKAEVEMDDSLFDYTVIRNGEVIVERRL